MKKNTYNAPPFSCLTLADSQKFLLRPTDPPAAEIVAWITKIMHLSPGSIGREIFRGVTEKYVPESIDKKQSPRCRLSPIHL
jgi:hypothetical protein